MDRKNKFKKGDFFINIYDSNEFAKITGVTLSDHYFRCTLDSYVFGKEPDEKFEDFCQDWTEEEKDNFITCHKDDFKRLEDENLELKAEVKRLKLISYTFNFSDGTINLSIATNAKKGIEKYLRSI